MRAIDDTPRRSTPPPTPKQGMPTMNDNVPAVKLANGVEMPLVGYGGLLAQRRGGAERKRQGQGCPS